MLRLSTVPPTLRKEIEEEKKKLPMGEEVSLEKITEILLRVGKAARLQMGHGQKARKEDGEFNDFLEKRRPFLAPEPEKAEH